MHGITPSVGHTVNLGILGFGMYDFNTGAPHFLMLE